MVVGFGAGETVVFFGTPASVVAVSGHQVVYSVMTSLTVTVAVETKAGETDSWHLSSEQEVIVTKVVAFSVAVAVVMF